MEKDFVTGYSIKSLHYICFYAVVNNAKKYVDWNTMSVLPHDLKNKFLDCFSSRKIINDSTIVYLIDERTTHFTLGESVLSDAGLQKLKVCRNLQSLNLSQGIGRDHINHGVTDLFRSCHKLTCVNLRNCTSVTNKAVVALAENNPFLTLLDLSGCVLIGDEALEALGDMCHLLEGLELSRTKVSSSGVLHIANSPCSLTLKEFGTGYCKNVAIGAVTALLKHCPHLQVLTCHVLDSSANFEEWKSHGKLLKYTFDI